MWPRCLACPRRAAYPREAWGGVGGRLQSTGLQGLNLRCQALLKSPDIVSKIKWGALLPPPTLLGTRTRHLSKLMTPKQQGTTDIDQSALHPLPPHHNPPFRTRWALKTPSRGLPLPHARPQPAPTQSFPENAQGSSLGSEAGTGVHSFSEQMLDENLQPARGQARCWGQRGE